MKMKKIVLSIALLTVTGNMVAGEVNMVIQGDRPPTDVLPSASMQKEAAALLDGVVSLNVNKDRTIQLPADLLELMKNTFSVARTMTSEEGKKIEQLHMAYAQINNPWWRNELTQVMGKDNSFMDALKKYDTEDRAHQMLWNQLWQTIHLMRPENNIYQDISNGNVTAAQNDLKQIMAPVTVSEKQQAAAEKALLALLDSSRALKALLTELQDKFKEANKDLEQHLEKIEYLVKQNVQWMIAFGIAIKPDFAKTVTTEMTEYLTKTFTNLHTSPAVIELQNKQKAIAKK